jgi:hypothetical protein
MKKGAFAIGFGALLGVTACGDENDIFTRAQEGEPSDLIGSPEEGAVSAVEPAAQRAAEPSEPGFVQRRNTEVAPLLDRTNGIDRVPGARASCEPSTSPQGGEVWRRSLGQSDVLASSDVAIDAAGNVFVSTEHGTTRLDAAGNLSWTVPFGSLVAAFPRGTAVVAGTFSGQTTLGDRVLSGHGGTDAYVATLDDSGVVIDAFVLGGPFDDVASGLAVGDDFIVISGTGIGTVVVDSTGAPRWQASQYGAVAAGSSAVVVAGSTTDASGGTDAFIASFAIDGRALWSRRFGDTGANQRVEGVAVDAAGSVFLSGVFDGSIDFGGGPLSVRSGACAPEVWCKQAGFVAAFDEGGTHVWSRARTPVRSLPGIAVDSQGNVFASGAGPGNAPPYRTILLLEYDADGTERTVVELPDRGGAGAGHGLAVGPCDATVWTATAPTVPGGSGGESFVTKLTFREF